MAVAVGGMALPIAVMGLASQLFGLQWFESLFIGVIFSATSVSISVAVLREFNQIDSKEGRRSSERPWPMTSVGF